MTFKVGEVWKIKLYPDRGREQDGLRPCLIVSPNSMNKALETVIVAPLTTSSKNWPTRINVTIKNTESQVCIEHISSVSKERFIEKISTIDDLELVEVRQVLQAVFSE